MKKMKGAVAVMESSPSAYATAPVYDDTRTRSKYRSLMQDYDDLYKETEAKKMRLHMLRQKKMTLMAEVRFLRRRYKFLMQNQSSNPLLKQHHVQQRNLTTRSKSARKERSCNGIDAGLLPPVPRFDLNQKGKIYKEREAALRSPSPIFDLNQKQKTFIGKEAAIRNSAKIPDLNQNERIYRGKEATIRNTTPVFDLNQISMEEEELQGNGETMRVEEPKISLMRIGSDDQHNEMKLSVCRNVGNGSSRTGKRKISWQDQVALRV